MEIQIVIQDGKVTDASLKLVALSELERLESTIEMLKRLTSKVPGKTK